MSKVRICSSPGHKDVELVDLEPNGTDGVTKNNLEPQAPPYSAVVATDNVVEAQKMDGIKKDNNFSRVLDTSQNGGGDIKGHGGKIKGGKDEDQKDDVKVIDWNEFMQNTTFHGVKYIFEDTPIKLRRILWFIMVVGCIIFFVVQVGIRTQEYWKHEANIDMELSFEDKLPFPAVTICNQNAYRMTKVAHLRLYQFVRQYYGSNKLTEFNFTDYDLTMDAGSFVEQTAHQLTDLVDNCIWMKRPCNLTEDFSTSFTQFGVCYTFNGDAEAVKYVDDTAHALSLVLNVEQYEHMRGPQNDAGLKMFLHPQDEVPLMKEFGFAVAPGTHTLVTVSMKRRLSMEEPWGRCVAGVQPMANCKMAHQNQQVVESCGCKLHYMTEIDDDTPFCTLHQLYACVEQIDGDLLKVKSGVCSLPCNVTMYEPSLSYADLSSLNIDSLALSSPGREELVAQQYRHALDSLHRLDEEISESDVLTLTALLHDWSQLQDSVANMTQFIDTEYKHTRKEVTDALERDIFLVSRLQAEVTQAADFHDHGIHYVLSQCLSPMYDQVAQPVEKATEELTAMRDFIDAQAPKTFSLPISFKDLDMGAIADLCEEDEGGLPGREEESLSIASVEEQLLWLEYFYYYLSFDQALNDLGVSYNEAVSRVYDDKGKDPSSNKQHQNCIAFTQSNTSSLQRLEPLRGAVKKVLEAAKQNALLLALEDLQETMSTTATETLIRDVAEEFSDCDWMTDALDTSGQATYDSAALYLGSAEANVFSVDHTAGKLSRYLQHIVNFVNKSFGGVFHHADLYVQRDLTKLELCKQFTNNTLDFNLRVLTLSHQNIKDFENSVEVAVTAINSDVISAYDTLFKATPPVLDTETLRRFTLLGRANSSGDASLQMLWDTLGEERIPKVHGIVRGIFHTEMYQPMENIATSTSELIFKLERSISGYRRICRTFEDTNELTATMLMQNFLQVDIFYNELSQETISQKQAFSISSLFSEVGGFMGLLLGASILTLGELIDYIVMLCLVATRGRKRVAQQQARDGWK